MGVPGSFIEKNGSSKITAIVRLLFSVNATFFYLLDLPMKRIPNSILVSDAIACSFFLSEYLPEAPEEDFQTNLKKSAISYYTNFHKL